MCTVCSVHLTTHSQREAKKTFPECQPVATVFILVMVKLSEWNSFVVWIEFFQQNEMFDRTRNYWRRCNSFYPQKYYIFRWKTFPQQMRLRIHCTKLETKDNAKNRNGTNTWMGDHNNIHVYIYPTQRLSMSLIK